MARIKLGRLKNPHRDFEKRLGYSFRNKRLLETALVHRSFRFENNAVDSDNQRLEFLGDAVLSLVAAACIYHVFKESDEGLLTRMRSRITSGKALAKIGRSIELGKEMRLGKGEERSGGRRRDSNVEDALEALIGAAYLDGRIKAAEKIFRKLFLPELEACGKDMWADNPKGRLQEISQRRWSSSPHYRSIGTKGPAHARIFTVEVVVNGVSTARGEGKSKQEAEVLAAISALRKITEEGSP